MLTTNTERLRTVVADHVTRDAVIQGDYWDKDTQRGCFIGCLAHDNKPELIEQQYGLPVMLQRIAESIFERLPADEAKVFFAALPDAIRCDRKDLTRVGWQFLAAELRALPQQDADIQAVIDPVIAGMDRLAAGHEWHEAAARAAARAARAAEAAHWATNCAARAAEAAEAAHWAACDITCAGWATNCAARAAAFAVHSATNCAGGPDLRCQRDLLLQLIAEAPITKENF